MMRCPPDVWTPKRVSETMIDALKWARKTAGPVGPRGFTVVRGLNFEASDDDSAVEGWGVREIAGEPDEHQARIARYFTLEQISLYEKAMRWQAKYLVNPGHRRSAIILNHWLKARVEREFNFQKWLKEQGVSRTHAYRVKDKGLSLIAQGLHRDGERVPAPIQL